MAYDDSIYRRRDSDTTDPGMHRLPTASSPWATSGTATTPTPHSAARSPPAVLDDVFDDPSHGDPGRDRMAVHVVWEILLLLGAAGVAFLLLALRRRRAARRAPGDAARLGRRARSARRRHRPDPAGRRGQPRARPGGRGRGAALRRERRPRGWSTRSARPPWPRSPSVSCSALFVVVLHVPGWAASLGAALVVIVFIQQRGAPVDVQGAYDPTDHASIIFGGFAAVAVLGGLFGSVKAVRRAVGRFRPVADPARRRGRSPPRSPAGLIALSMPMAAVAGVLHRRRGLRPGRARPPGSSGPGWRWARRCSPAPAPTDVAAGCSAPCSRSC